MRILYVGNSGGLKNAALFYLFPPRLLNGFIREGHNIHVFNDRDMTRANNIFNSSRFGERRTNKALLQTCHDFMPHMIILAHCEIITNDTLERIRKVCQGVKIIHRNVDPLSSTYNIERVKNRLDYVDGIFVTTAGDILRQFTSQKTFSAFLPNPIDPSIDTGRAFAAPTYDADLFFAAGNINEKVTRRNFVSDLLPLIPNVKTDIYGANINNRSLFGLPYMEKLARVKMGLIINKTEDFYLYASDRMSQYMGNGMMVFASDGPHYTDLFSDNEIVTYDSTEELVDKIKYYAAHDDERRKIAEKGYLRAHQIFNNQLIARYIVETTLGNPHSSLYPFPHQIYRE